MAVMPIKRKVPFLGLDPDYSRVLYPDPPSHDFCIFLIIAEMMRRHHCPSEPLKVRLFFQDGLLGKYDYGPYGLLSRTAHQGKNDLNYSNTMVTHVLRPAIEMIGAIAEPDLHSPANLSDVERYCEYDYHIGHLIDAAREGFEVPQWTAPQWARNEVDEFLQGRVPVVITLRETAFMPQRNSNFQEWLKFAEYAQRRFSVIVLRDSDAINFPCAYPTYWRASSNAYVRMALYEKALCNLMVQQGPSVWCQFSDAPYLFFKQLIPELPDWDHGNAKGWREQDHMEIGDQLPWAKPNQRMTWKNDRFEEICEEFEAFLSQTSVAA